jgi:uncharacterized protein
MLYYLIIFRSLIWGNIIYGILIYSMIDLKPFLVDIAEQYRLDPGHTHGLSHWARVLENGLKLVEVEGGDNTVIGLFAIFHDACRHNQSLDHGHLARGARLADKLDSDRLDLARVGIMPHPRKLCTRTAKDPSVLNWANDRALAEFSPSYVEQEWAPYFK